MGILISMNNADNVLGSITKSQSKALRNDCGHRWGYDRRTLRLQGRDLFVTFDSIVGERDGQPIWQGKTYSVTPRGKVAEYNGRMEG